VGNALSRRTLVADWRQYWMLWRRDTVALRLLAASSDGDDPRAFVLGGPYTLRAYDFWDYQRIGNLAGPHMVMLNLEYRIPLLAGLVFDWPARWAFGPVGATVYWDMGAAWDDGFRPFGHDAAGRWGLEDLRAGYGVGLRLRLAFLPLRLDWARRTDLRDVRGGRFHFSIGYEF
jgi:outer membrane protein assembly factor BamA